MFEKSMKKYNDNIIKQKAREADRKLRAKAYKEAKEKGFIGTFYEFNTKGEIKWQRKKNARHTTN